VNNPGDPGSWSRYAYTRGDPVNRGDPAGTCDLAITFWGDDSFYTDCDASLGSDFNPAAYAQCMATPGCYTQTGGQGSVPAGFSIPGMNNAASALQNLLTLSLGGPCSTDLSALAQEQLKVGSTGAVGKPVSAQTIDSVASTILQNSYVYNGSTSPTPYTVANFGSLPGNQTPFAGETVGDVFNASPGIMALSQKTGYAIFVNSSAWAGFSSNYATATMLHEIIHRVRVKRWSNGGGPWRGHFQRNRCPKHEVTE
jgi:hypothetical protein